MPTQIKNFTVYRAKNGGGGTASQWQLSRKEKKGANDDKVYYYEAFLTVAKQTADDKNGNATFAWQGDKNEKAIVKLGEADLGELISVLERRKNSVGMKGSLFHQSPDGSN